MTSINRESFNRESALAQWYYDTVQDALPGDNLSLPVNLEKVSGDASFRRYFRVRTADSSMILVDAPVDKEDCRPFITIAQQLARSGVTVPEVLLADTERGFMCLSDFGDQLLWESLRRAQLHPETEPTVDRLYRQAFDELVKIQQCRFPVESPLPPYDLDLLLREMELFRHWFCTHLLDLDLSGQDHSMLDSGFQILASAALAQPRVTVHRDYHSRNLLLRADGSLGVIDFQDAVLGPITYDLVSLLRDCYIDWPPDQVENWALTYLQDVLDEHIISEYAPEKFLQDFDLMGIQRHLKAVGIFSRLHIRDGKNRYLSDIPRCLSYLFRITGKHDQLQSLNQWLGQVVIPAVRQCPELSASEVKF